jgi:hypothetical protein
MSKLSNMMSALIGPEGYTKLSKAIGEHEGTALGAYVASRAVLRWFYDTIGQMKSETSTYVDMPGVEGTKVYIEKHEDETFAAELIRDGAPYYVLDFKKSEDGGWNEKATAVPNAILAENGITFDADAEELDIRDLNPKLGQTVDGLVRSHLAKTMDGPAPKALTKLTTGKRYPGEDYKVKDDVQPEEKDNDDQARREKDPSEVKPQTTVAEVLRETNASTGRTIPKSVIPKHSNLNKDHDKDMASKKEPLSKPPVSEAQRRAMHAAASGHSTLDIPKTVGKEFSDADKGGKLPEKVKKAGTGTPDKSAAIAKLRSLRVSAPAGKPGTPGGHLGSAVEKLRRMGAANRARTNTAPPSAPAKATTGIVKPVTGTGIQSPKTAFMGSRVAKADAPGGAAQPKMAKMPKSPKPPTNKMPRMKIPQTHGGPQLKTGIKTPAMKPPKKPPMMIGGIGMGMGGGFGGGGKSEKSEKTFIVTEQEIYRPCLECGIPEFVKSEDGPRFKPCACFLHETRGKDKFVELIKDEAGHTRLKFSKNADPEAQRMFVLLLKASLLAGKNFPQ